MVTCAPRVWAAATSQPIQPAPTITRAPSVSFPARCQGVVQRPQQVHAETVESGQGPRPGVGGQEQPVVSVFPAVGVDDHVVGRAQGGDGGAVVPTVRKPSPRPWYTPGPGQCWALDEEITGIDVQMGAPQ
ncbi:hypothetical protein ACWGQ5_47990 [Streptomyces sp. NPDC055722]